MKRIFVVSDIHGQYDHFEKMLANWNREDQFVILGDLIDRGPKSLQVIQTVIALQQKYPNLVTFIKGNHEDMLINFLENPSEKQEHYYRNGGLETITSMLAPLNVAPDMSYEEITSTILTSYANEMSFLKNAPLQKIIGNVLFTHAGFNSEHATIEQTTEREFIWIRKHYEIENKTPYINVFGHTPVHYIHDKHTIWVSKDHKYVAIDGGCYMSNQLNGLLISENGEIQHTYIVAL